MNRRQRSADLRSAVSPTSGRLTLRPFRVARQSGSQAGWKPATRQTGGLRCLAALGLAALPQSVQACAACFGKSDDALARGMNMGIFSLLIVITSVLIGLVAFFIFLARRSARFAAEAAATAGRASSAAEVLRSDSQTTP